MGSRKKGYFSGGRWLTSPSTHFGLCSTPCSLSFVRPVGVLGGLVGLLLGDLFLSRGLHVRRQFERPLAAAAGKRAGEQRRDC